MVVCASLAWCWVPATVAQWKLQVHPFYRNRAPIRSLSRRVLSKLRERAIAAVCPLSKASSPYFHTPLTQLLKILITLGRQPTLVQLSEGLPTTIFRAIDCGSSSPKIIQDVEHIPHPRCVPTTTPPIACCSRQPQQRSTAFAFSPVLM